MKWLILSLGNTDIGRIEKAIDKGSVNSIIYDFSCGIDNIKDILKILSGITNCVFLVPDINSCSSDILFVIGFLIGRKIPVYTTAKDITEHFSFPKYIYLYEDKESLENYIETSFDKIFRTALKRKSLEYLFDAGMPFTPDCFAINILKDNQKICECYLAAGMDINSRDSDGTPMLNIAARNDKIDFIEWLLKNGADINSVSEDRGYTAVMDAVWRGNEKVTELLIKHGADLNVLSKEGQTVLVLAVGAGKKEICKLLAENGADPNVADSMGMTAYGYAKLFKKDDIVKILEKYHKA